MSTNGHTLNKSNEDGENDRVIAKSVGANSGIVGSDLRKETYSNGIGVQHTSVSNTVEKATKLLEVLMKMQETISLHGNSTDVTHSINASDVDIIPSPDTQTKGSSMVRISNIVDYGWEQKYYTGNVVAVHTSGIFIAYCLKALNKQDSLVRILNKKTLQRALIKGISGEVKDLAFSHTTSQIILAIVDETGTLHIYQASENSNKAIDATLLLKVTRSRDMCEYRRVSWCHYHPDEPLSDIPEEEEIYFRQIVATHDNNAEVMHVDTIIKAYGEVVDIENIKTGIQKLTCHDKPISEAIFAPDGSAIATASLNGEVRFYQVYLFEKERELTPRCLHKWEPHGGRPVNSLFFLDNHKHSNPCQSYWKFAVTGADENSEIKIWCCVDWACLQTLRFNVPTLESIKPCLKASIDASGEYLLLSDITRKVLYVLQFYQEPELNKACVVSLSEFPLIFPMLSFSIMQAGVRRVPKSIDPSENVDEREQSDEAEEGIHEISDDSTHTEETVFKLLYVQPKSLQECRVAFPTLHFVPQKTNSADPLCAMSQESIASYRDGLSDLSIDRTNDTTCVYDDLPAGTGTATISTTSNLSSNSQLLLTPEAFSSPSSTQGSSNFTHHVANNIIKPNSNTSGEIASPSPFKSPASSKENQSLPEVELGNLVDIDEQHPLATSERIPGHEMNGNPTSLVRRSHHSSSSSPSREVAEILSENGENKYKRSVVNNEAEVDNSSGTYKATSWPAAPDIQKISQQSSPRETSSKPSHQSLDISEQFVQYKKITDDLITDLKKREKTLDNTVQAMSTVLQNQQEELVKQKQVIMALKDEMRNSHVKVEKVVTTTLDVAQHQQESRIKKLIETVFQSKAQQDKKNNEQLTSSISQLINNKMDKVVRSEVKNIVMPALPKMLEPIFDNLQLELRQRISSFENNFKEHMNYLINSKQISETIGNAVSASVQSQISQAYRDSFQNFIFPSFEKSCQNMFEQLNGTFFKGTNEYLLQLETISNKKKPDEEKLMNANNIQLKTVADNVQSLTLSIDAQKKKLEELEQALSNQQETLCNSVVTAMRSRSETPVRPYVDSQLHQQQVQVLVKQGKINAAFQQALSVADLSVVLYVCEQYDPNHIFSERPCPLEQPVILSLIQQFSTDLKTNTEIKYKYLEEALVNFDVDHPSTKSYLHGVCKGLQQNLELFLKTNVDANLNKRTKLLLMITKSFF